MPRAPASRGARPGSSTPCWHAEPAQIVARETRQHGDREDLRPPELFVATDAVHLRDRLLHHRQAARRVQVEHAHAHPRRLRRRFGHRPRDVVELEIEKYFPALLANHADDRRSGVQEELLADLEKPDLSGRASARADRLREANRRRARRSGDSSRPLAASREGPAQTHRRRRDLVGDSRRRFADRNLSPPCRHVAPSPRRCRARAPWGRR